MKDDADFFVLAMRFVIGIVIGGMIGGSWVLFWDAPTELGVTAAVMVAGLSLWYGDRFLLFIMRYIKWFAALAAILYISKLMVK